MCVAVLVVAGCATKKWVRTEVGGSETRTEERIDLIKSQIEDTQKEVESQGEMIGEVSTTAQEALDRAIAAGKLAEGKLLYERVLSGDKVRFDFDRSELSDEAKSELDAFGGELVGQNENVFVEIQGHTDATGSDEYNLELGEDRAEAVRRYLSSQHGIPLHRMSVISYGESAPIADNDTRENRARNRRVTLVVLK
jgi:outer membrane protein OmpA-like peptidoglycan-associated protein